MPQPNILTAIKYLTNHLHAWKEAAAKWTASAHPRDPKTGRFVSAGTANAVYFDKKGNRRSAETKKILRAERVSARTKRREERKKMKEEETSPEIKALKLQTNYFHQSDNSVEWREPTEKQHDKLVEQAVEFYRGKATREEIMDALKKGLKVQFQRHDDWEPVTHIRSGAFYEDKANQTRADEAARKKIAAHERAARDAARQDRADREEY